MYIRMPVDPLFVFDGPHCRLKIGMGGGLITHPQKGEMKVYFPQATWAFENGVTKDGEMFLKEPVPAHDMHVQMGAPHPDYGVSMNRMYAGFEVPDYLRAIPVVLEIVECLRRTPGVIVSKTPIAIPD